MRIRQLIVGLLVGALGLWIQPAAAIEATDMRPLIPVTDPAAEAWYSAERVIELTDDVIVVLYKENEYSFKVSTDAGETWGEPTAGPQFGWWSLGVGITPINATKFLLTYRDNSGTYWSEVGTVSGTSISFGTPTVVYTPANDVVTALSTYVTLVDGDDWYAYLPLLNYNNFTGAGELAEFHSNDQGQTWTRSSTLMPLSDQRMADNLKGYLLEDGRRVVFAVQSDINNNRYAMLKVSNGANWDVLSTDSALVWATGVVINGGKGIAMMGAGTDGHDLNTFIWEDVDSTPTTALNQSDEWAGGTMIATDGGSTIAVQFVDKMNPPNSYGGRSAEILVTKDFGATWTSHIFETIPDDRPADDYRLYGGFLLVGEDGGILAGYATNAGDQEGFTFMLSVSEDKGTTWTEPAKILDGYETDSWGWTGSWHHGKSPVLIGTVAIDITNQYYMSVRAMKFNIAPALPEKLVFHSKFQFGKVKLTTKAKADLRAWADQIADGTSVIVRAPNFVKPDLKRKAKLSLARANAVAAVLRNAGLNVTVVKGKVVKAIAPSLGRLVVTKIPVK